MGSSIKINSISIDLAGAANEIDMVKCDHFSIRGYVAETRERDHTKCWPFKEGNQESYPLPSLSVPKFRWWRCMSCIRDINADETKDLGLHANSTSISGRKQDGISSVIPSQSKLNSLTVIDQEKESNDTAGDAVVENEDANCERSQTVAATMLAKKDHPPAKDASTVRSKIRKLPSQDHVGNKRSKVNKSSTDTSRSREKQNVTTFASSDIAGVVDDTPPKAFKNHKEGMNVGFQRRKTRKVRLLSELIVDPETKAKGGSNNNIRQEESCSKARSGRKRKVPAPENNYVSRKLSTLGASTSENASKSCDSDDQSESSDSGFDRDLIKGKKKNRRFQVVDEFVPCETSQEGGRENDAGPSKCSAVSAQVQRTEKKLSLSRKKKNRLVMDNEKSSLISFSTQSTKDLLNEKRVGSSLDELLASEGYFRKPIPQVNDRRDNAHVRPRDAEANCLQEFGSSSKSNTAGWLRTGVDAVDFSTNNNNTDRTSVQNFNLRSISSSTEVAEQSSMLQKDATGADRKGKTVMVQEPHGSQTHDRKENTPEEQNDDITLEIAELMAKNQYERCLPDKEDDITNKQPPQETAHKSKKALLIDLNETYDNGTSMEDNNTSKPPKPACENNARKEQKSFDFFPISQPYVPSPFGNFPPTQDVRANSIRWIGNVPTTMANQQPPPSSYRVLRGCNTCYHQSAPHQYREAPSSHQIWMQQRPQCHHHTPVSYNMEHQSTRLGMFPQAPPQGNDNTWNLNFVAASNGKAKCDGGIYSNESSIPALNLLSLMDPSLRSNAPVDHTNFTRRHFPPVNQTSKGVETGDSSKTAYTTKQSPFNFYSNGYAPEASRKSFPIGPPLGTSSFSFQNAQAPWSHHHHHHHHQEKITKSKPVFPSCNDQGRFQLLRGSSNSMKLPLKEMNQKKKAESSSNLPLKNNSSGSFVCSVNRNPADFTVPEPGSVYMLTSENLKVRKRAPYKTKASLCKEDAMKQTKKTVGSVTENA